MGERVRYVLGQDEARVAHESWYRGEDCRFLPSRANLAEPDAAAKYVLDGWLPPEPFITRRDCVTAFGSCFAQYLSQYLVRQGYTTGVRLARRLHRSHLSIFNSHVIRFGEGIVNTFALRQQFEWAYEGREFSEELWFGSAGELAPYLEEVRRTTREIFDVTDVFLVTLGLSEVWYNRRTGEVFWRAIPRRRFDPEVHGFRSSTCAENLENLRAIVRIVRTHRPRASIVFSLSPVPLVATFRPVSCVTANAVSKSVLRVAVDELMRSVDDERVFYWPSYELVKEYYPDPFEGDNRHVRPAVIDEIMELFRRAYLVDGWEPPELMRRRDEALAMIMAARPVDRDTAERMYEWGVQEEADIGDYEAFRRELGGR